jgi:hypothetical protein
MISNILKCIYEHERNNIPYFLNLDFGIFVLSKTGFDGNYLLGYLSQDLLLDLVQPIFNSLYFLLTLFPLVLCFSFGILMFSFVFASLVLFALFPAFLFSSSFLFFYFFLFFFEYQQLSIN